MSLALPSLAAEEVVEPEPLVLIDNHTVFDDAHRRGVQRDFRIAQHRARNGFYRLVVTPDCVVVRRNDSSAVTVDLVAGCQELSWLKQLYRTECPKGIEVKFGEEEPKKVARGNLLEGKLMLIVHFILSK